MTSSDWWWGNTTCAWLIHHYIIEEEKYIVFEPVCFIVNRPLGRIQGQVKWLRQSLLEITAKCWEPLRHGGELHIPYVRHYSTLAYSGSCGGSPFHPFDTNGMTKNRSMVHCSVFWPSQRNGKVARVSGCFLMSERHNIRKVTVCFQEYKRMFPFPNEQSRWPSRARV